MSKPATPPGRALANDPRTRSAIQRLATEVDRLTRAGRNVPGEAVPDPGSPDDDHETLKALLRSLRRAGVIKP